MLVFTRRKGEGIVILENIKITVSDIKNGRVKLSIEAPKSISVNRKEVVDKVRDFNLKAVNEKTSINEAQIILKSAEKFKV